MSSWVFPVQQLEAQCAVLSTALAADEANITTNAAQVATSLSQVAAQAVINTTQATQISGILASVGAPSGIAPLDANGRIPVSCLNANALVYQGLYNASTNVPVLSNATLPKPAGGSYYIVSTAGSVNFGDGIQPLVANDMIIFNTDLAKWEPVSSANHVQSFNGRNGAVTLLGSDVSPVTYLTADINTMVGGCVQLAGSTMTGNLKIGASCQANTFVAQNLSAATQTTQLVECTTNSVNNIYHWNGAGGSQTSNAILEQRGKGMISTYLCNAAGTANLVRSIKLSDGGINTVEQGIQYGGFPTSGAYVHGQLWLDRYGVATFSGDVQTSAMGSAVNSLTNKNYVDLHDDNATLRQITTSLTTTTANVNWQINLAFSNTGVVSGGVDNGATCTAVGGYLVAYTNSSLTTRLPVTFGTMMYSNGTRGFTFKTTNSGGLPTGTVIQAFVYGVRAFTANAAYMDSTVAAPISV